jgi:GntR family transcriptional regulator, transcriptional repressor for pyruvate dehydrogenase complex
MPSPLHRRAPLPEDVGPPTPDRELVSEHVFRTLCESILSGRRPPGEKLPTQRRLAAELRVNLASVREALRRLEQLRLVEIRHGDATRVRDWRSESSLDIIGHAAFGSGGFDRAILLDVLRARTTILTDAARLAAERHEHVDTHSLYQLAHKIRYAPRPWGYRDYEELLWAVRRLQELDLAFFADIIQGSGNLVYVLVLNTIRDRYLAHHSLFGALVSEHTSLIPLYTGIARAIADGEPETAARLTHELASEQARRLESSIDGHEPDLTPHYEHVVGPA